MSGKEDRIRARAYELWERNGRAHGNHDKCSKARQAEMAELRAREKNHE